MGLELASHWLAAMSRNEEYRRVVKALVEAGFLQKNVGAWVGRSEGWISKWLAGDEDAPVIDANQMDALDEKRLELARMLAPDAIVSAAHGPPAQEQRPAKAKRAR